MIIYYLTLQKTFTVLYICVYIDLFSLLVFRKHLREKGTQFFQIRNLLCLYTIERILSCETQKILKHITCVFAGHF